jgi:hypothetical protein
MRWARLDGKNSLWVALRDLSFSGHNWLTLTIGKLNWISTSRSARGLETLTFAEVSFARLFGTCAWLQEKPCAHHPKPRRVILSVWRRGCLTNYQAARALGHFGRDLDSSVSAWLLPLFL